MKIKTKIRHISEWQWQIQDTGEILKSHCSVHSNFYGQNAYEEENKVWVKNVKHATEMSEGRRGRRRVKERKRKSVKIETDQNTANWSLKLSS